MSNHKEQVNFYFDKNVWSHDIMNMSESDCRDFLNLIQPLRNEFKIGICYSPINILELINGIKLEEHYLKCQEEIRMADRICGSNLLESPWHHVQRIADTLLGLPIRNFDISFLQLYSEIAMSPYTHIEPKILPIRKLLNRWIEEWVSEVNAIILEGRRIFGLLEGDQDLILQGKKFRNSQWTLNRKQREWISFCQHFSLPSQLLKNLPFASAYQKFHSFRYWVDYRLTYENKLIFEKNRKAQSGDYFDWQQVVYLNIMDYLVTKDTGLMTILKECENTEMHHVAISFNQFRDCLRSGLPPKRAPESSSKRWLDIP